MRKSCQRFDRVLNSPFSLPATCGYFDEHSTLCLLDCGANISRVAQVWAVLKETFSMIVVSLIRAQSFFVCHVPDRERFWTINAMVDGIGINSHNSRWCPFWSKGCWKVRIRQTPWMPWPLWVRKPTPPLLSPVFDAMLTGSLFKFMSSSKRITADSIVCSQSTWASPISVWHCSGV